MNLYAYALSNPIRYIDPNGLWVRLCARKLGDKDNKPVKPCGNPLRHDYLSVSGTVYSFQAGSDGMLWSDGYVDDDEHPTNPKCKMICDDDKFDKYVEQAAAEVGDTKYCVGAYPGTTPWAFGANNCQTWARKVLKKAKRAYLKNEDCPKCFRHSSGGENIAP